MKAIRPLAIALLALTACHSAEPPQLRDEPVSVTPDEPAAEPEWLNDSIPRIEAAGITLRADTPGVMLITRPDGSNEFINLDTSLKVTVTPAPSLAIDGRPIPSFSSARILKVSGDFLWLSDGNYKVVITQKK